MRTRSPAALAGMAGIVLAALTPASAGAVEVQRVVSPGGIEAWLVQTDVAPVISIDFAFDGGITTDPEGKEGRANLVSTLLDEGAGDLDSAEFQKRLANAAIGLDFTAGVDAFYGSLQTTVRYADEAFGLLRLALTEPRFDDEAIARMKAAVAADIRRTVDRPDWLARRAFYDAAFPGHPYARPSRGTIPSLEAIAADDLRAFVRGRFARDNLTIGVAGDISAEELAPVLDTIFGALPARSEPFEVPETSPGAPGEVVVVEREGPQSVLLMAQQGIPREHPDYYPAMVMNYLLGGGGFESRLTEELRAKRGLTYGVSSQFVQFEHADLLMVQSALSNQNVGEALRLIRAEWQRMKDEGVSEEELQNAKVYLTGSFPLNLTSTGRISSILLGMQLDDLGIDYLDTRNAKVEAVTVEDLGRVAATLLDPEALTTVIVGKPDGVEADRVVPASELAARELGRGRS